MGFVGLTWNVALYQIFPITVSSGRLRACQRTSLSPIISFYNTKMQSNMAQVQDSGSGCGLRFKGECFILEGIKLINKLTFK